MCFSCVFWPRHELALARVPSASRVGDSEGGGPGLASQTPGRLLFYKKSLTELFFLKKIACVAIPICESTNYTFSTGLDRIRSSENWNGDASLVDWVSTGTVVPTSDGNIALTLSESDGGSVLSLARALWYGDVAATFKTGRWAGVVTAYITFSGTKVSSLTSLERATLIYGRAGRDRLG